MSQMGENGRNRLKWTKLSKMGVNGKLMKMGKNW